MAPSLRNRKKQTRLAFQPLPSSSPSKSTYSSAVQNRLANVRLEGVKATQWRAEEPDAGGDDVDRSQPSDQSLQPRAVAPATSSPTSSLHTSPTLPSYSANNPEAHSSDDDDDIPVPSSKRRRLVKKLQESNIHSSPLTRRSNRLVRRNSPLSGTDGNGDESTEGRRSLRSPLRKLQSTRTQKMDVTSSLRSSTDTQHSPSRRISSIGSAETSGDDEDVIVSKPVRRKRAAKSIADDPFVVEDDEEIKYISSDKEEPVAKPSQSLPRKSRNEIDDFIVPEDEVEYITSDEENSEVEGISNRQRHDQRSSKKSARKSRKEREELEEDLLDLQDSDEDNAVQESRTRGGPVTTQRDRTREHFERLKRRRAGERMPRITHSDDEVYEAYGSDDDGADIDDIGREPNRIEILSDNSSALSLIGAPDGADQVEDAQAVIEEGEDDFIIDDEGGNTGRHGRPHPDIPLEFTKFASAKPKELFIHIVEWMVKNKISPAFSRDDGVYTMSFSRIDDQVKAQAGSRLISSAWSATFKHAILARPSMKVRALPGLDEDNIRTCDACNRTNHPARYDFKFSGQPYHKHTLEPVEDDEDEEDRDDEDTEQNSIHSNNNNKAEYDDKGHLLASEHTHFYLGRFCAANAEMGHKLSHWKHHLNESVLSYLEAQGVLSPEAIVARDKLNKKKREKEAEAIVDMMDETGMVQRLWQGFQDNLEDAKFGMEDHVRSGGRGKDRIGSVKIRMGGGRVGEWNEGGRYKEVTTVQSDSEGE